MQYRRCIIPVSGYYEWKTIDGQKQPYYFTDKRGPILSIAGIWDEWTNPEDGKKLKSCAMLITSPNMFVQDYHDRMPVLLQPDQFDRWLSAESGKEILVPAREELLQTWPVSKRVNSSRTSDEDSTLIEAVAA
jgi:putative SOS response-associated peptidase YedK